MKYWTKEMHKLFDELMDKGYAVEDAEYAVLEEFGIINKPNIQY